MKIRMLPQQLLLRYDHFEGRSDFILAHFEQSYTSLSIATNEKKTRLILNEY